MTWHILVMPKLLLFCSVSSPLVYLLWISFACQDFWEQLSRPAYSMRGKGHSRCLAFGQSWLLYLQCSVWTHSTYSCQARLNGLYRLDKMVLSYHLWLFYCQPLGFISQYPIQDHLVFAECQKLLLVCCQCLPSLDSSNLPLFELTYLKCDSKFEA